MNYEKAYKEALERARDLHDNHALGMPFVYETCENIFPELRESEDEKIRKEIIQSIKDNMCVIHKDKCLTWLEKQSEQKPIEQDTEIHDLWVYIREWNDKFGRLPKDEDELASCIDYVMKRQKPADKVEHKSAWSEEDEKCFIELDTIIYQNSSLEDYNRLYNWLKSLKERVQPQSMQNWSEEDDYAIEKLLCLLDNEQDNYPQLSCDFQELQEIKDWLKFIKSNHWKPSEQNLKDLEWCADLVKDKMGVGFHRLQVFIDEIKKF